MRSADGIAKCWRILLACLCASALQVDMSVAFMTYALKFSGDLRRICHEHCPLPGMPFSLCIRGF